MVHALNSLKSSSKSTKNMMSYSSQPIDETIPRFTIMYALKKGYLNLIRHLLCTGVNPNQTDSKDKHSRTPLIYCAYIKDTNWALSIAQNLLECGANIKQCDNRGLNVLHYCCTFNKYKLLELFLNSLDFDLLNEVDINGNTCLHYATAFRNLKCIRLVLSKCKQYNLTNIERENAFEFKPSDMLNLNHIHFSKEIDEKCKLILVNYERNLLPNRKSFDNLANIMPLNNDKKHRPITAPLSTNEEIDSDDERKQKITFSESEAHRNQKKRSFSTQSQNIMKLKIQNENILPANQNKEISSHFLNSNSLFSKNEYFSKSKMKAFQLSKSSFEADDYSNQLVIKMKDYLSKTIIFSELCVDKEYIVNPKGINSMMIVNNYHFHQSSNLNPSKSTLKNACTKDQLNEEQNEGRVLSSKTQKSIQSSIEGDKRISQNNLITSKPPLSYIKPHCLTSMTGISGRQSRQSFFTGCLVSSQSGKYEKHLFLIYLIFELSIN